VTTIQIAPKSRYVEMPMPAPTQPAIAYPSGRKVMDAIQL
jgi:hypothetical protein